VRSVIFDLGGVVFEWNPDFILAQHYKDTDLRSSMKAAVFQHPDWLALDRGVLTEAEAIQRIIGRTHRSESELSSLFEAVRQSLVPKADTVGLLERLSARGVPLYCLSNMPASTFRYLQDRHSFWDVFRGVVISGDVKMMKPDREIFEYLLRRYELTAGQTIFVDDHLPNVYAARAAGLHAIQFVDAEQCESDLDLFLAAP
jgi:HAD superfamily hydrolase (TIGR01509 family)